MLAPHSLAMVRLKGKAKHPVRLVSSAPVLTDSNSKLFLNILMDSWFAKKPYSRPVKSPARLGLTWCGAANVTITLGRHQWDWNFKLIHFGQG